MTGTISSPRKVASALAALMLASAGAISPVAIADTTAPSNAAHDTVILLSIGESRVVNLSGTMTDVIVADPGVADVHVRSQRQLYILGKAPGESEVTVTTAGGKTLYSALVRVNTNLTSIDQMLKLAMPDADITVTKMNGLFLLTGTVKAPEDAAEAQRLVQAFTTPAGAPTGPTVVSRLRTATPLQVNLQVKISEVSRNLLHKIGTNWNGLGTGAGSFTGYIGRATRAFGDSGNFIPGLPSGDISRSFTFHQPTDSSKIGRAHV